MKKTLKVLPVLLSTAILASCGGGGDTPTPKEKTLTNITASLTSSSQTVGDTIDGDYFNIVAYYSDESYASVKASECTFSPTLPYTFVDADVENGKDFIVTYKNKTATAHAKVNESPYNMIDWNTTKVDGTNTLYLLAKNSKKIVFGKLDDYSEEIKGVTKIYNVQEPESGSTTCRSKIKAYVKEYKEGETSKSDLYILSNGNYNGIYFSDNDRIKIDDTHVYGYFYDCHDTESIVISSRVHDYEVTDLSSMFEGCTALKDLKFSLDVSVIQNFSKMFKGCSSLTSLDLTYISSRDNGKNFDEMFSGCNNLVTIYSDRYFTADPTKVSSTNMFKDCVKLVGGRGTAYDATKVDGAYAWVDGDFNAKDVSQPGYFTNPQDIYTHYEGNCYIPYKKTFLTKTLKNNFNCPLDGTHAVQYFALCNIDASGNLTGLKFGTDIKLISITLNNTKLDENEYEIKNNNMIALKTAVKDNTKTLKIRVEVLKDNTNVSSLFADTEIPVK